MTYDQAVAVVKDAMGKKISASVDFVNVDEGYKVSILDDDGDWSGFYAYSAALDCIDAVRCGR
jgi:hypothetical protein